MTAEHRQVVTFEMYGKPLDAVLQGMMGIAGSGVTLNMKPDAVPIRVAAVEA